jgi:hypothetical protein
MSNRAPTTIVRAVSGDPTSQGGFCCFVDTSSKDRQLEDASMFSGGIR